MKESTKAVLSNKKIIASFASTLVLFVVLVLALIIQFNPALGWFSQNKEILSDDMNIKAIEQEVILFREYRVYKHNYDSDGVEEVSNNVEGDPLYLAPFSMNEYDTILTEHNENTHVVIRVVLEKVLTDKQGITLNFISNQPIASGDEAVPLDYYVTNICGFRAAYGNPNDTPEQIYNHFESSSVAPVKFVTVERDGENFTNTKAESVLLELSDFDDYVYTEDGVNKLCVNIEISYDDDLVMEYLEQNDVYSSSINDLLEMTVDFFNDLEPIEFNYR